jgi:hypothetical protein
MGKASPGSYTINYHMGGVQSLENRQVKTQEQLERVADCKTTIIRYFDNF